MAFLLQKRIIEQTIFEIFRLFQVTFIVNFKLVNKGHTIIHEKLVKIVIAGKIQPVIQQNQKQHKTLCTQLLY